ncbi:MAG: XrtA/PEP-CTERM system TPR-repeat protein PrsT [Pseudomonadota bacterium]
MQLLNRRSGAMAILMTALVILTACQPSAADRLSRAENHLANGDYAAAILESRGALQDEPANLRARIVFANASRLAGDYRTAAAEYERARQLGLDDPVLLRHYADVLLIVGQPQVVVSQLSDVLRSAPRNADALATLAHALTLTDQWDDADMLYQEALAMDDANAQVYVGLATLSERRGQQTDVAQWLRNADSKVPGSPLIALYRAQRSADKDAQFDYLLAAYNNLKATDTPALRAQILLARVENHLRRDEVDQASAMLAEYRESNPGSPESVFFGALVDFERGDLERAKAGFLRLSEGVDEGTPADLFLGSINLQQANLRQAEAYLNNALRYDSDSVQARKLLAETLLQLGRSRDALEILADLNQSQSDDPQVLAMLGRASIASGDAQQSIQFFERSAAASPDDPSLKLATAYSYLAAGDTDAALQLLENLPDSGDGSYRAELLRMLAHLAAQDEQAAIAEAERVVAENPDDPAALSLAGQLMVSLGNNAPARMYYERALRMDAGYIPARYGLGRLKAANDDLEGAYAEFSMLLDQNPGYFPAVAAFGRVALDLGREDQAILRVRKAIDAAPESPAPRIVLAQYYLQQGDYERARDAADEGLAIAPDNPNLLRVRGQARSRLGLDESSRRDILRAAELSPDNRDMQFEKSRLLLAEGDVEQARKTLTDFLALKPNDVGIKLFAADIDLRSGAIARAERAVESVLADEPQNRAALIIRGDVHSQRGELQAALARYDDAAALDVDRLITLRRYVTLNRLGDSRAMAVLEDWLAANPGDTGVETIIAQRLDVSGDSTAAVERYQAILDRGVQSPAQRAIVLNNLAWLYHAQGDSRALPLAEQARELLPESGAILDTLGWILFSSGEQERSLPLLREAAELEPGNPDIQYHLAAALAASGDRQQALRILERTLAQGSGFTERDAAEALVEQLR